VVGTEVHTLILAAFLNLLAVLAVLAVVHLVAHHLHLVVLVQQVKDTLAERRLVMVVAAPVEVALVRLAYQFQLQTLVKMAELVSLHQLLEQP
jgi:hypothetical protein